MSTLPSVRVRRVNLHEARTRDSRLVGDDDPANLPRDRS